MKIINLTQHAATQDQIDQGVFDLTSYAHTQLLEYLTFHEIPTKRDLEARAEGIASLAIDSEATHAMIGGAPYLMAPLETAIRSHGIIPLYAFSKRESVEQTQKDGSVRKVNVFRHVGFVE